MHYEMPDIITKLSFKKKVKKVAKCISSWRKYCCTYKYV